MFYKLYWSVYSNTVIVIRFRMIMIWCAFALRRVCSKAACCVRVPAKRSKGVWRHDATISKLVRNVTDICFMCLISHPGAVKDVCLSGKGSSHLWVEVLTSKLNTNKPPWEFVWNLHHLESLVPHFLRPRTTHLWCLQGSTAGSKLCSDSICAKGAAAMWCLLVLRIIWELSSWKLQFEHVNLRVYFLTFCIFCREI